MLPELKKSPFKLQHSQNNKRMIKVKIFIYCIVDLKELTLVIKD